MRLPVSLEPRDNGKMSKSTKSLLLVGIIAIVIFVLLIITYILSLRLRRRQKAQQPKKDKLPSLFEWKHIFRKKSSRGEYSTSLQNSPYNDRDREMTGAVRAVSNSEGQNSASNPTPGVDRNTSIRSVMTLPAYAPVARENERILGREGERGGIDTVLEFPETMEEEEGRRENEMESLYQIRLARRTEAAEREARRQARREARMRGDQEALAEIRRCAEIAAEETISQMLIAEHQSVNRERRVSSVQYGDLGVARHDGTRLRASSMESDNRPLLDSAASISGTSNRNNTLNTHTHLRGASFSSVLSVSSRGSDDFEFPEVTQSRSNSNEHSSHDFEVVSLSHPHSRSASRVATPIPPLEIPNEDAPAYEPPPNYESPVATRPPTLPTLERLPSIQITTEPTPVDGRLQDIPLTQSPVEVQR